MSLTSPWPDRAPSSPLSQFLKGEWELHGLDQDVVLCGLEASPFGPKFFLCTWGSESSQTALLPAIRAFLRTLVPPPSPWELGGTCVSGNNTMVKGLIVHLPALSPFIIPCPPLHHLFCPSFLIKILTPHHFFIALKSFPNFTYLLNPYLTDLHAGYFSCKLVKKLFLGVILG